MVLLTEVWAGRRLLRPFLGVGVLGGFTTFSAYAVEIEQAVSVGAARTALLYLGGTLVAAMLAVGAGAGLTGAAVRTVRRRTAARRTAAPKQIAHRPDRHRRGPR
jgi:CrcB protein